MKALLFAVLSISFGLSAYASDLGMFYKGRLVPGVWGWDSTLNSAVSSNELLNHNETQIDGLCSGYRDSESKRKIFWQQLFISLAWKESLHGPKNYIKFNGGTNNGLYQINPKLRSAYGCGSIDLFDADKNIECAAKMAKKLIDKFGSFLSGSKGGMAAYWQPLRSTTSYNRKNREFILASVREACKTDKIEYHSKDLIAPPGDMMDLVDVTVNGTEDLGLDANALENDTEDHEIYEDETFVLDPASGTFFDFLR